MSFMNFTDKEIFHNHTKQLIDILKGDKNPKIVLARNSFERKIIYEFCEANGWDYKKISGHEAEGKYWDGYRREYGWGTISYGCWRKYRMKHTSFKLTRKLGWTKGIVRDPLEEAGLCSDVVIHHVYPYLNDLYKNELSIEQ